MKCLCIQTCGVEFIKGGIYDYEFRTDHYRVRKPIEDGHVAILLEEKHFRTYFSFYIPTKLGKILYG